MKIRSNENQWLDFNYVGQNGSAALSLPCFLPSRIPWVLSWSKILLHIHPCSQHKALHSSPKVHLHLQHLICCVSAERRGRGSRTEGLHGLQTPLWVDSGQFPHLSIMHGHSRQQEIILCSCFTVSDRGMVHWIILKWRTLRRSRAVAIILQYCAIDKP